jgi:LacI family transcriptional regulator
MYYPEVVRAIEKHSAQKGCSLVLCNMNGDLQKERKVPEVVKRGFADGVIALTCGDDAGHLIALKDEGVPIVLLNRAPDGDINCASIDHLGGAYDVVSHLIEMGHRKISAVLCRLNNSVYRMRRDGALEALRQNGLAHSERYFILDADDIETARHKIRLLLMSSDRPTAFFVAEDILAFGAYSAAAEMGLSIPGDISVAGFGGSEHGKFMIPPLTTYDLHTDEICKAAVENLLRQIAGTQEIHEKQFFRGDLIDRGSVAELKVLVGMRY